jgi:hypothetical protein
MAITASTHAWAICRNVERLCGAVATAHDYAAPAAEGAEALANAAVNAAAAPGGVGLVRCNIPAAVSSMCLSLGKQSALYSTVPTAAAYFATAAALTETLGGPPSEEKPWAEMIDNCWLKFNYCVDRYTVTLCGGSDAWWRAHDEEFLAEVGAAAAGSILLISTSSAPVSASSPTGDSAAAASAAAATEPTTVATEPSLDSPTSADIPVLFSSPQCGRTEGSDVRRPAGTSWPASEPLDRAASIERT